MAERELDIDQLRAEVEAISEAVRRLRVGISEEALLVLIQHAAPHVKGRRVTQQTIRAVLDGVEGLDAYVFCELPVLVEAE